MTNSGTESVEAAIKLARYHTGRSQFIGFLGGFHGRTMGAVTFTASKPHYHKGFFPLMNGVVHAPFPDPYRPILHSLPRRRLRRNGRALYRRGNPRQDRPCRGSGRHPGRTDPG